MRGCRLGSLSTGDWALAGAIPVLLVVVAMTQIFLASTTDLTPWRGGGFGMFSTLDGHNTRQIRVEATLGDGQQHRVDIASFGSDDGFARVLTRHRAWPRDRTLKGLGRSLTTVDLTLEDDVLVHDPGDSASPVEVAAVQVEVWAISLDTGTNVLELTLLDRRAWQP